MLLSLAAPFNGKPAILHQSGLGILVALTASVLVLLVL